jgi:NADPH2:quinone reductase
VRAALCPTHGPPEIVGVTDVPAPALGPGQVRVNVATAAVNFPDVLLVADTYQLTVPTPFVPGSEFAGVIDEVAGDDTGWSVGERVFGTTLVGAFAEQVVVDASALTAVPPGASMRNAAAFGVAHRTAYHVLRSVARLQPGEQLIVLGAGGGVGLAAVQLGVVLGASVTAVASSAEKLAVAGALGATTLIDHATRELRQALREELAEGGDVVLDPVGGTLAEPALRGLRWGGRYVTVGYASGEIPRIPLNLVLLKGVAVLGFQFRDFATHAPHELVAGESELMQLFSAGGIAPHIGAHFALEDTAAALRYIADGHAIGKVVIDVRDDSDDR